MKSLCEHGGGTTADLYEGLCRHALAGFGLIQLEKNVGHFGIGHYTLPGALQRRIDQWRAPLGFSAA
jgi:hypothetical protein